MIRLFYVESGSYSIWCGDGWRIRKTTESGLPVRRVIAVRVGFKSKGLRRGAAAQKQVP